MCEKLYHGSIHSDLKVMEPISKLHNTDRHVVYLTGKATYALFYIWDSRHNKRSGKYVTAWVKNGITYYEEHFPDQLKTFYDGVKGYLYTFDRNEHFVPVANRESMYASEAAVAAEQVEVIENVYEALMASRARGELKVISYEDMPKERITDLYGHIAQRLAADQLIAHPDTEEAVFYQTYFKSAWEQAIQQSRLP